MAASGEPLENWRPTTTSPAQLSTCRQAQQTSRAAVERSKSPTGDRSALKPFTLAGRFPALREVPPPPAQ